MNFLYVWMKMTYILSCFIVVYWWWVSEVHVYYSSSEWYNIVHESYGNCGWSWHFIVLSIDKYYFPNIVVLFSNIPFDIFMELFDMPNFIYNYIYILIYIIYYEFYCINNLIIPMFSYQIYYKYVLLVWI